MTPLTSIRNIGPAMAQALVRAGIQDAETLRALGPDAAYQRMVAHGHRPHFIGYYAMVMGLQGRPWNDLTGDEKTTLRARFDRLVAAAKAERAPGAPSDALAAALDALGVVPRDRSSGH